MLTPHRAFAASLCFVLLAACAGAPRSTSPERLDGPVMIATWPFGVKATDEALAAWRAGASRLDMVERGIREVERWSCDGSVGIGGRPNAAGYPQLDACIMDGPGHRAGSVMAIEGVVHPITAARLVMERTRHVILAGEGARWFAMHNGVEAVTVDRYEQRKADWQQRQRADVETEGHDTITLLLRGADGHVAGGCSSSGAANKLPGRVGDAPLIGGGLYVDDAVGAAGATGIGENVMRHCATFQVVERMRAGLDPQAACEAVLHDIAAKDPLGYDLNFSLIALDRFGRVGAATTSYAFPYAVATKHGSQLLRVEPVKPR